VHLLLITGFLGSGKTSLVIKLAEAAASRQQRVAILINEIGEIGIDDQLLRQLDLNVWEMVNGCICCTLSADLVTTLEQLDRDYDAQVVLLEPSGAAEPGNILRALPFYKGSPLESIRSISVLDPLRFPELFQVMTPLLTKQIAHAELLLITKADLATEAQLDQTREIASQQNPDGQVRVISLHQPLDPDLLTELMPWLN
jgi:G3E family GTPase